MVEETAAIGLGCERSLRHEARQQRLDRRYRPAAFLADDVANIGGAQRAFAPQRFHHGVFGVADALGALGFVVGTHCVLPRRLHVSAYRLHL